MQNNSGASDRVGSTREHVQENSLDQGESRPANSTAEGIAENMPEHPVSVSSVSVHAAGSSDTSKLQGDEHASRPTDDEIIAQENLIRAEEAEKVPYVGDIEPLLALEAEYRAGNEVFVLKIQRLAEQYHGVRRARGDGNCFFRSFVFAYLEQLINTGDTAERDRLAARIAGSRSTLVSAGFQELVFEDGLEVLAGLVNAIGSSGSRGGSALTVPALEARLRDGMTSNLLIMFLRFLTSAEVQLREDWFAPFILGMSDDELSVEGFCRRHVEPMGEESDHVHIVALSDALQVPTRVVYLDRSLALGGSGDANDPAAVTVHDFTPEALGAAPPRVHVLYRPGHYDILYPRS